MKTTIMGLAAFALILTSCKKDDQAPTGPESNNPDVIQFSTNTTKASIMDLPAISGDVAGFRVYATNPTSASGWFPGVDGTASYRYSGGAWGWSSGAPQWPTTMAGYPINFYAYHPVAPLGFTPTVTPISMIKGDIVIRTLPSEQSDFLASTATATTKPISGKLSLTFSHITSKINFGVIAGAGQIVEVQSLTATNLKNTATYDYLAGAWGAPSGNDTYVYYGKYYPSGTGGTTPIIPFTPLIADESTANPFYAAPHNKHLMLMPQTTLCWDKSATVAHAYIGAIYRISSLTDPNMVGYTTAASHPNFVLGSTYIGPLFAKVGFPFADTNLVWDKAKGYTYNLQLGTVAATNGYYVDTFYYDINGNKTTYPVVGKSIGDPVSDGTINFTVNVTNWMDQPALMPN